MPFEAYKIYQEYEPDKYKTSTEQKVAKALSSARKEGLSPTKEGIDREEAREILGENFFGPDEIEKVFAANIETVPDIPFSREELERAKELGQQLILQVDAMTNAKKKHVPLTLESLKQRFTKAHDDKPIWYEQDWYNNEDLFKKEKPRTGWRLTSKDLVPGSTSKSYLEQTDVLIEHLQQQVFKGMKLPKQYEDAIAEFKLKRSGIEPLAKSGTDAEWRQGSQMLVDLAITKLTRELSVEVMYRLILNDQTLKDKPLPSTYTWTASLGPGGTLVHVGFFGEKGVRGLRSHPDTRYGTLGVSFSRS
jgi:hypothetical protein